MSYDQSTKRRPYSTLTTDQITAIDEAIKGNCLIVGTMGSGKTVIAASAATQLLDQHKLSRVLVVSTPKIANTVWQKGFTEWAHTHHIVTALASGDVPPDQRVTVCQSAQVVITTFNLLPFFKKHDLFNYFDGLIIDETTKLTAAGGKHTSSLKHAAKKITWRIGLTGTPVDEGPDKLYTQLLLIDNGRAFGTRKESFLREWFYPTDYKQRNWELKPDKKRLFYKTAGQSIHVIPDYRHELPQITEHRIDITPPDSLLDVLSQFRDTGELDNMSSPTSATDTQKMGQLASGFYYDDDNQTRWISIFRIKAAISLINDLQPNNVIVAFNYIAERDEFLSLCPHAQVLTAKNDVDMMDRWNAGKVPILLVHPASAGHGIELQHGGHVIIYLSNQWSLDKRNQLNARVWRRGQRHPVHIYYFRAGITDDRMEVRLKDKSLFDDEFTKELQHD